MENNPEGKRFEVDVYALRKVLDSYGQTGLYRFVDDSIRQIWIADGAANPLDAIGHVVTALGKYRKRAAPRWAQARIAEISERDPSVLGRIVKKTTPAYTPQQPSLF